MVRVYNLNSRKRNVLSGFSMNSILIFINVVFFIVATILILVNTRFLDYIALKPSNILAGKYLWTFLTSMFMHGGLFHLFANMISLMFVGSFVQKILGAKRYLYFYLISGLFAGLLFVISGLIFSTDLNTYAVGASGALFGLIGVLMLLTPNQPVYLMFIPIPVKMKYAAPGMLIVLWLISIAGNVPIGNMAHLGGLISGLVYGIYLKKKFKKKTKYINKYFS
jgi:membrane associated rhomboid family serine protease